MTNKMTISEILFLSAGYETNKLITEHVFDMRLEENHGSPGSYYWVGNGVQFGQVQEYNLPYYSDEIEAAWVVVEKVNAETHLHTHCNFKNFPAMPFGCRITKGGEVYFALAETMPLAICRAALLAVMGKL